MVCVVCLRYWLLPVYGEPPSSACRKSSPGQGESTGAVSKASMTGAVEEASPGGDRCGESIRREGHSMTIDAIGHGCAFQ